MTDTERTRSIAMKINETGQKNVGPVYIVTVPDDYTDEEMQDIADLTCALPRNVIGAVIVARTGTSFSLLTE